jgi:membrane protein
MRPALAWPGSTATHLAEPRWRWVNWGGAFAAIALVAGSAACSRYVRDFGGYDVAYGPLSAIVILMT